MNEKVYRRIIIILVCLCLIMGSILIWGWFKSSDIRDDVERLQTQLRAAQDGARQVIGQLGALSLDYIGVENDLRDALSTVEHQQESIGALEFTIKNASNSNDIIGTAITDIGEFIIRVEEFNRSGVAPITD